MTRFRWPLFASRRGAAAVPALLAVAGLSLVGFATKRAARFARYEVVGGSMLPTLRPGDWLLADTFAYACRAPRAGDIAVALDPRDASRPIIKRVASVDAGGSAFLQGDNPAESTDSRVFGAVPTSALTGRVRLRYWPNPRIF